MKKYALLITLLAITAVGAFSQSILRPPITASKLTDPVYIGDFGGDLYITTTGDTVLINPWLKVPKFTVSGDASIWGTLTVDNLIANSFVITDFALDSVYLSYGSYQRYYDQFGNLQNVFRLNPDNSIGLGTNLAISGLYTLPNHRGSWFDIGIDSDADYGDVVGISGYIGGDKQIDIRGQADGAGGLIDGSDYIWVKSIYDSNGNALHESVTGDSQLTDIKAKYFLEYVGIDETNGGTVTVQMGTTAGASDVFTATSISANGSEFILAPYRSSTTSETELYISDTGGGWGTAELTVYLIFRRYAE